MRVKGLNLSILGSLYFNQLIFYLFISRVYLCMNDFSKIFGLVLIFLSVIKDFENVSFNFYFAISVAVGKIARLKDKPAMHQV